MGPSCQTRQTDTLTRLSTYFGQNWLWLATRTTFNGLLRFTNLTLVTSWSFAHQKSIRIFFVLLSFRFIVILRYPSPTLHMRVFTHIHTHTHTKGKKKDSEIHSNTHIIHFFLSLALYLLRARFLSVWVNQLVCLSVFNSVCCDWRIRHSSPCDPFALRKNSLECFILWLRVCRSVCVCCDWNSIFGLAIWLQGKSNRVVDVCVCVRVCAYMCIYVYIRTYTYIYIYIYIYRYIYEQMYMCIYVYIYIHIYIYIYTYI